MADVTGEGRYTSRFTVVTTGGFPGISNPTYDIGMSSIYRRSGTAADQVDRIHALVYTFVASTAQEIDFLALVGPRIRDFTIKFLQPIDPASYLDLGGAASDAWAEITGMRIRPGSVANPGGMILSASENGYPVSSTSKQFKMTPSAHAFSILLRAVGASV